MGVGSHPNLDLCGNLCGMLGVTEKDEVGKMSSPLLQKALFIAVESARLFFPLLLFANKIKKGTENHV